MFKIFIQRNMIFWDREKYVKQKLYFTKKNCPFCIYSKDEEKLFLYETDYWKIIYNKFPYYWNKHLMAIPKRHIKFTTELNKNELIDYKNIEIFIKDFYKEKNYYSFIRQTTWWRSVEHLHYHYLPWDILFDETNHDKIFRIKNI